MAAVAATLSLLLAGQADARERVAAESCAGQRWVGAWLSPPSDGIPSLDASIVRPILVGARQSYRVIITPHASGSALRLRLTNRFGSGPVTFARVAIGRRATGAAVQAGSLARVTFDGRESVTVARGEDVVSDPVSMSVKRFAPVTASVYVESGAVIPTQHFTAMQTTFFTTPGRGDHTLDVSGDAYTQTATNTMYVSGLEVLAPASTGSVVAFGDSITDGYSGSNPLYFPEDPKVVDADVRYTDFLQRRLDAAGISLSVINAGISGNRLRQPGLLPQFGPSGLSRLQRDVLDQAGVTTVIMLIGVNDLGLPPYPSVADIQGAYTAAIASMHQAGFKVLLGTLMPAANSILDGLSNPNFENLRSKVNAWIRTQKLADAVIDFDAATRNPGNPAILAPEYTSPDNIHPNAGGYRRMADIVDLSQLVTPACKAAARLSTRRFRIRVPRGFLHAAVTLDGRRLTLTRVGGRLGTMIDLRGRPRGSTATVRVTGRTAGGRRITQTRRFRA